MTRFNSLLFFSFIFLSIWTSGLAQEKAFIPCPTEDPDVCPGSGIVLTVTVCANYPTTCETTPCPQYKEFPTSCDACKDPNVDSYFVGPCLDINTESNPDELVADEGQTEEPAGGEEAAAGDEPAAEEPAGEADTSSTAGEKILIPCPTEDPDVCPGPEIVLPVIVCAHYPIACITTPCPQYQEFSSSCDACKDPNVDSYFVGPCLDINLEPNQEDLIAGEWQTEELAGGEEEMTQEMTEEEANVDVTVTVIADGEEGRTYCELPGIEDPDAVCSTNVDPVCSYAEDCDGTDCGVTASNSCVACNQNGALYYTEGACAGDEN